MSEYKKKAGIKGKRCSPHTLRATCARRFLDCGGDPFTLQKILGHARLDMTRQYLNQSDAHIKTSYRMHSPVDNMKLAKKKGAKR
jgi:integrase/recombinase XerD